MVFANSKQEARFWKKVARTDNPDECWNWTGARCPKSGYGKFRVGSRIWNVHRLVWEQAFGALPENKQVVRHERCRNRLCVNVRHLAFGTYRDNWVDSVRDGTAKPFLKGHRAWNKGVPMREETKEKRRYTLAKKRLEAHPAIKKFLYDEDEMLEQIVLLDEE